MESKLDKIGIGGSCHWCTEAIFQSLRGVENVEQGWIASNGKNTEFSEAIIIHFDKSVITIKELIAVHLYTHSCTSNHSMRGKYRSAVYVYDDAQKSEAKHILNDLQAEFEDTIVTSVLDFKEFKLNDEKFLNYYQSNPDKPFCQTYINPKLKILMTQFSGIVNEDKVKL